jgi:hypothetical protein
LLVSPPNSQEGYLTFFEASETEASTALEGMPQVTKDFLLASAHNYKGLEAEIKQLV